MSCRPTLLLMVLMLAGLLGRPAAGAVTSDEVNAAVDHAKDYVWSQQKKDGTWEESPKPTDPVPGRPKWEWEQNVTGGQWGGQTALGVLALLAAGESPQDTRLTPAIEFLKKADINGTYALCMRMQVLMQLPETPDIRNVMRRDAQRLVSIMHKAGPGRGFYGYVEKTDNYNLMGSQYGVLGVWAGAQAGVEVPRTYWNEIEKAWTTAQEPDGGWRYQPKKEYPPVTAGVTAVGLGTMFMVKEQLYGNSGVDCVNPTELPAIQKGIDWIANNFDRVAPEQKTDREFPNINLYAVERIGAAGGLKYFGKHDWYAHGTDFLLRRQRKDGSWGGGLSFFSDTCYGLLFLSRGRSPVIFNKLDWVADDKAAAGNWNARPRDIANVTRWIGRTSERDLNWQIVSIESPIKDWHDAPLLYISGSEPVKVDKAHQAKLKEYVEAGGMIFVHADCGKGNFASSIRNLTGQMFPDYELRELPSDHPIYSSVYSREKWKNKPSVMGISNGVRELMVFVPQADPGKIWQLGVFKNREEHWQLAANILYYAADQRNLRNKGDSFLVADDPSAQTTASLKLARLKYKGNWDPEPGGWRRLRNLLRRDDKLDMTVQTVDLDSGSLDGFKMAHLTGTTKLKLTEVQKLKLKRFIAAGGTLVVDAAGGSEAFANALESEMASLGTGAELEILPPDHSLFGGKTGPKIGYRVFAQKVLSGKLNTPRIKAVRVGDRPAVLFSREDLSAGLVGQNVGGIVGYTPGTATELMRRIVLRSVGMEPAAPAATKPAKAATKPTEKTPAPKPAPPIDDSGLN